MNSFFASVSIYLLLFLSLFLIVLVLIQRGKGGGLAGALGGAGGQSAFGTKAGDLFTKITIGVAAVWILLCILMVRFLGVGSSPLSERLGEGGDQPPAASAPVAPGEQPAGGQAEAPADSAPARGETK